MRQVADARHYCARRAFDVAQARESLLGPTLYISDKASSA